MKKLLPLTLGLLFVWSVGYLAFKVSIASETKVKRKIVKIDYEEDAKEESLETRSRFAEERFLYEYYRQVNPKTGEIPQEEKLLEFDRAKRAKLKSNSSSRSIQTSYVNRGPSNFGGRTRALVVDRSDTSGNTIIAGGVSGGVFRTTDGGQNWIKVSSNDEIHNVTSIVQDPRSGQELVWYYGTGESIGNSARLSGATYYGQGIWKSSDGGITWEQMSSTSSNQTTFDSDFDFIFKLAVHPTTGDLYAATAGKLLRYDGTLPWQEEIVNGSISSNRHTDLVITTDGRVYAGFSGTNDVSTRGVWTSATGIAPWTRINNPISNFDPAGRVVLALAPSNQNKLYVLFDNGNDVNCGDMTPTGEASLWLWNQLTTTFTNYSARLPDEAGCSEGNDPFSHQGGYDLVINVKPDDENFLVIGGTNAYKKTNITVAGRFTRIGGYVSSTSYGLYANHHPDIHAMVFNPFNYSVMFTGTDGGVHRTDDITATNVAWVDLNNDYQTLQYYHVALDPEDGSDIVIGGTQDNGTKAGGVNWGMPDATTQASVGPGDGVAVAISRDDACLPFFFGYQNGFIYRDCPNPDPVNGIVPNGSDSQFVTYFHLDQSNNNALYYAGKGILYRNNDATNATTLNWSNLGSPPGFGVGDNDEWFQIFSTSWGMYNAATSYLLMGGDSGHIYLLNNPQNVADLSAAVDITPPTATIGFPSIVTGLAIHPNDPNTILATYANYGINSIFLSTDKGASWTLVERNLSAHSIRSAAIVEDNGETQYFVGTARGLYSSPNPATTDWVREAPTQIGFALVSSLKYRPSDHKLLIGTHGNGMYEATISSVLGLEDFNNISDAIKLYPNPVRNSLNVKLPQADGLRISYMVSSISGQTIATGILDKESIDVSQLSQGMYFLQIKTNDGRKGAKSFIKQ